MKLELSFPLSEGEKQFVRFMLDNTTTVEAQGGVGTPIMGDPSGIQVVGQEEWPPAEAVPKPKTKTKTKLKTEDKPKPEAVPEPEPEAPEAEAPEAEAEDTGEDVDDLDLATKKAVELINAKQRPKVREALEAVGLDRVSDAKDQDTAKKLYEALTA